MAVRLREADSIAVVAELQQQIAELEIQVRIKCKKKMILPTPLLILLKLNKFGNKCHAAFLLAMVTGLGKDLGYSFSSYNSTP